jgi:hypothetical protein
MNKTSYVIIILILIVTISYFNTGCKKSEDNSPNVTEYTIKVDSVHHPDTIDAGGIFSVDLYGKVGDNDCYAFKEIQDTIETGLITLELIGTHTDRENCNDGIIYMSPATANINGLTTGDWTLRITQPAGTSPLENTFFVK